MTMPASPPTLLPIEQCGRDLLVHVGGKAAGLGDLTRAGQRVPASFVVTAAPYADYVRSAPRRMSAQTRNAIAAGYRRLCDLAGGCDVPVAVRSSAAVEDSAEASFAGQFSTYLGVTGIDEVVERVRQCWESAFAAHVATYRATREVGSAPDSGVAVIVQELVQAHSGGVMFTQHPRTGDRSLIVIEASYGLGEAVVGGEITPDLYEVNKITGSVHQRTLGTKTMEYLLAEDQRSVHQVPVAAERRSAWALTDEHLDTLVSTALQLEATLGRGLDIEWAFGTTASLGSEPNLFALQVRPITVRAERVRTQRSDDAIGLILGRLSRVTGEAS